MTAVKSGERFLRAVIVFADIINGSVKENLSFSDEDNPVRERLNVLHVVGGQDDRGIFVLIQFSYKITHGKL